MTPAEAATPDYSVVRPHAVRLMDSWDQYVAREDIEVRHEDLVRYYLAFGLCAQVHQLGRAVFLILDADLAMEATPMIRTMFECAITAQWVYQVPGASEAFLNRQSWEHGRLLPNLPSLGVASITEKDVAEAQRSLEDAEAFETKASASFKAICHDLQPGGTAAYVHYQLMCRSSHPSNFLVDRYFARTDSYPGLARRPHPEKSSRDGWAGIATGCLVWAGQAVAYGDLHHQREPEIDDVAAWLGIARILNPTEAALARPAPPRR